MGRTGLGDYLALTAGFAVFALVFNSGKDLVYSMAAGSALLALLALILYWPLIRGRLNPSLAALSAAPLYSLALYLLFYAGNIVSRALGLGGDVERVYAMVEATVDRLALLGAISVAEELYWRGGIQESLVKSRLGRPWWLSAIPYSLAHVSSGITVLVPAALVAGLVLGLAAHRHGIATAIIAHYTWLILSFKIAPYQ